MNIKRDFVMKSCVKNQLDKDTLYNASCQVEKRTIFYHFIVILQYVGIKRLHGVETYRDDSGIFSLVIKCFGITNTLVQNFTFRISSVKTTEVFAETKSFLNNLI